MEAVGGSASTNNANHRGLRRVMKRTRNDGAADGEETISNPRMKKTMRFKMLPDLEASYTPPSRNELENIVMRAGDKLHSNNSATVLFTLQHLASMTSPKNDRTAETVHILSELIMENKHQLWNKVAAIYAAHSNTNLKNEEISLQIMNACLRIVSNVLLSGLVTSRERRSSQNLNVESIFIDHFIPLLTDTVAQYTHTYNACLAMKCIAMLVDNSSHARQRVSEVSNIGFVMEQAMLYGCTTNLMLQQTATSTIETFRHHLIM